MGCLQTGRWRPGVPHLRSTRKLKNSSSTSPNARQGLRGTLHVVIARWRSAQSPAPSPAGTQPRAGDSARRGGAELLDGRLGNHAPLPPAPWAAPQGRGLRRSRVPSPAAVSRPCCLPSPVSAGRSRSQKPFPCTRFANRCSSTEHVLPSPCTLVEHGLKSPPPPRYVRY